jgi:hypothetical protein
MSQNLNFKPGHLLLSSNEERHWIKEFRNKKAKLFHLIEGPYDTRVQIRWICDSVMKEKLGENYDNIYTYSVYHPSDEGRFSIITDPNLKCRKMI